MYFKGAIDDDYGFTRLTFHCFDGDKEISKSPVQFSQRLSSQDFYYAFDTKQTFKRKVIGLVDHIRHPEARATLLERDATFKSIKEGRLIINWGGAWGKKEIVPAEWYGDGADATFEGIRVIVPTEYDKWLTQVYGNYMQLPPEEKRITHHYTEIIDPYKPYTEYGDKYGKNARK